MATNSQDPGFRIVAAVSRASHLGPLLALGSALAASRKGSIVVLYVSSTGERPSWLTAPETCGGVPVEVVVQKGDKPAHDILATLRRDPPDLLLLAWSGESSQGRFLLGRNLDSLVQDAPCNAVISRTGSDRPSLGDPQAGIRKVLIPAAGGPNALLAVELALSLSPETEITALNVAREVQGHVALSLGKQRLDEILEPWADEPRVKAKVVQSHSIIRGILAEASRGYDLLMIGASHESYLDRVLFGNVPQTVVAQSTAPAVVVKRHTHLMRVGTWFRRLGWRFFGVLPTLSLKQQTSVYKEIRDGAQPKIDFFVMIALSAAIATFGLLQDSPAVIIGAMLVAPLMSAIFGLSLGIVRGDPRLLRRAASATLRGVLLAVAVGALLAFIVPVRTLPNEVTSRIYPNMLDLGVAVVSGAAGAYALCRKEVSAALPGVAIAAALVPPLSVIGIGIAFWDGQVAGGATLLFTTNLVAISAAGGGVFLWLGFRPIPGQRARAQVFRRGVIGSLLLLVAVSVPLGILSVRSVREATLNRQVSQALNDEIGDLQGVDWDSDWEMTVEEDGTLRLEVIVRSRRTVGHKEVVELQERLATRLQRPVALLLSVIPATSLDPFVPPTPLPLSLPRDTATLTPSPTPTHTPTPTPVSYTHLRAHET